jgi:hypothetical protein
MLARIPDGWGHWWIPNDDPSETHARGLSGLSMSHRAVRASEPVADEGGYGSADVSGSDGTKAQCPGVVELLTQLVTNVFGGEQALVKVGPREAATPGECRVKPEAATLNRPDRQLVGNRPP